MLRTSVSAEIVRTDSIDEYIDVTTSFISESDSNQYYSMFRMFKANDFENRRLLLLSDSEFDYRDADTVIISPDGQYVLSFPTVQAAEEAYNYYISQGLTVIPDVTLNIEETADTSFYTLSTHLSYGPNFIHADEFNELLLKKYGSVENMPEVRIAVVDTGVNYNHTLLKDRVDISAGYDFANNDSDPLDDHGHGSHVCGIIADNTLPNVVIVPYKILKSNGKGPVSALVNAINKAASSGDIDILNFSLGGEDPDKQTCEYFTEFFQKVYDKGIISVAAAGNTQTDANYICPANITDYTIAVSACDSTGKFDDSYSNYGSVIDFCAPGSNIYSSLHTGATAYGYKSGTSMAAPSVSSAFAMLKTYYPNYSVARLEEIMQNYAVDAGDEGYDYYYGYGYASLEKLSENLTVAETTALSDSGFTLKINSEEVQINTDNGDAVIVSASYDDNGVLTELKIIQESEYDNITLDDYSKIFVFDSLQGLKPLHDVITK